MTKENVILSLEEDLRAVNALYDECVRCGKEPEAVVFYIGKISGLEMALMTVRLLDDSHEGT